MAHVEMTLQDRLATLVTAMGYEFVGYELRSHGRSALLRIYIDKESGITLGDCSRVSHQVSAMLDVEDPIEGEYQLEISSPGLDRPLFGIAQFRKFIGSRIKVRMHNPLNNQRNFVGVLQQVDDVDDIHLLIDTEEVVLPFSGIEKARVIPELE
jgi:ribosome maturation factor RimP